MANFKTSKKSGTSLVSKTVISDTSLNNELTFYFRTNGTTFSRMLIKDSSVIDNNYDNYGFDSTLNLISFNDGGKVDGLTLVNNSITPGSSIALSFVNSTTWASNQAGTTQIISKREYDGSITYGSLIFSVYEYSNGDLKETFKMNATNDFRYLQLAETPDDNGSGTFSQMETNTGSTYIKENSSDNNNTHLYFKSDNVAEVCLTDGSIGGGSNVWTENEDTPATGINEIEYDLATGTSFRMYAGENVLHSTNVTSGTIISLGGNIYGDDSSTASNRFGYYSIGDNISITNSTSSSTSPIDSIFIGKDITILDDGLWENTHIIGNNIDIANDVLNISSNNTQIFGFNISIESWDGDSDRALKQFVNGHDIFIDLHDNNNDYFIKGGNIGTSSYPLEFFEVSGTKSFVIGNDINNSISGYEGYHFRGSNVIGQNLELISNIQYSSIFGKDIEAVNASVGSSGDPFYLSTGNWTPSIVDSLILGKKIKYGDSIIASNIISSSLYNNTEDPLAITNEISGSTIISASDNNNSRLWVNGTFDYSYLNFNSKNGWREIIE